MNSSPEQAPSPIGQLAYAEAMTELDQIVQALDDGTIDVDTLSDQFQRAIDIIDELDRRIMRTREQVDQLLPRLEAMGDKRATREGEST